MYIMYIRGFFDDHGARDKQGADEISTPGRGPGESDGCRNPWCMILKRGASEDLGPAFADRPAVPWALKVRSNRRGMRTQVPDLMPIRESGEE